nr:hypothetical protein [Tanacetum cinerariifolium]
GGADSASGLTSAGILVAVGPTVFVKPSSPIRDPAKGKAVATPSSPVTAPTDTELADQEAAILEVERQELVEQELKQSLDAEQVYLDSLLAQRVAEERERETRASVAQSTQRQAELDRVALNLTKKEWIGLVDQVQANPTLSKAIAEMKAKAKRDKPMTPAQQKEFMRTFEPTSVSAGASIAAGALIPVVTPIPTVTSILDVTSVPVGSSIPAVTPSAAGVSTTVGAFGSASDASDVTLRKPSRKKSIARRRSLPSAYKPKSDALPFDEDDPETKFKKYLRQVSGNDEPAEPVSLALVSDIRRADLMVLYCMVLDKYKIERATIIGLGLCWRFYALPAIHVLKTKARDIIYVFMDKKYPLTPETIQRMLNHGLEIDRDPAGNDLTTAI